MYSIFERRGVRIGEVLLIGSGKWIPLHPGIDSRSFRGIQMPESGSRPTGCALIIKRAHSSQRVD